MKQLSFLLTFFLFASCDEHFEEKELYGLYVPINYKNTFDTIELKPQGIYYRKVYDKNNKLALEMEGQYSLERNNVLQFHSYFLNFDRDIEKFPELLQDTSGGCQGLIESRHGTIEFCVGYEIDSNCYRRIK